MKTGKPLVFYYPDLDWKPQVESMLPGAIGYRTPSGNIVYYGPRPSSDTTPLHPAFKRTEVKPVAEPKPKKPKKTKAKSAPPARSTSALERRMFREWYGIFKD